MWNKLLESLKKILASSRFIFQFLAAIYFIWDVILGPMRRRIVRFVSFLITKYVKLWNRFVYDKYNSFRYSRAGVFLTVTIVAGWFLYNSAGLVGGSLLYLATNKTEFVYLNNSQEIYPDLDIHTVKGCESLPCSPLTAINYRVGPRLFNHVWAWFHNHDIFYPDYVAGAVPIQTTECLVTSYGVRMKFLMRNWDIYPDALFIICDPAVLKQIKREKA